MTEVVYHPPIYKKDSNGNARIWWIEQDDFRYRTHSGIKGGKNVISTWKRAYPTNLGKKNQRLGGEQATFEIKALYKKKLDKDYHESLEDIDK